MTTRKWTHARTHVRARKLVTFERPNYLCLYPILSYPVSLFPENDRLETFQRRSLKYTQTGFDLAVETHQITKVLAIVTTVRWLLASACGRSRKRLGRAGESRQAVLDFLVQASLLVQLRDLAEGVSNFAWRVANIIEKEYPRRSFIPEPTDLYRYEVPV
eukprot:6187533-Pleurochrysis_carterae.AAC.2